MKGPHSKCGRSVHRRKGSNPFISVSHMDKEKHRDEESTQMVTVTEAYIKRVTVNGTKVSLDANGQFPLNPAEGTQEIVATDKAGNVSSEITVTVNDGHTYEWQDGNGQYWKKCRFCGDETAKKEIPTVTVCAPQ